MTRRGTLVKYVRLFLRTPSAVTGLSLLGFLVVMALLAPVIAPYDPTAQNLRNALSPPSAAHLFGTDHLGRDMLSRVLFGSQISLTVAFVIVLISGAIGVFLGLLAGFYEGWVDNLISRVIDVLLAFPALLLALAVVAILGPSLQNALAAIVVSSIPKYVRLTRGVTLAEKQNEYVIAARALGASNGKLLFSHILRNLLAPIIVVATLQVGTAILFTAALSFLGMGAQPPTPEWGAMLSQARRYMRQAWWITVFPGTAIMLAVLGANLFGDGLRDILDPRLKRA